jgi:hypothetical protein
MYVYVNSDSEPDLFPHNTPSDFTCQLAESINSNYDLHVGLTEINLPAVNEYTSHDTIYICSQICEESYVNGSKLNILRNFHCSQVSGAVSYAGSAYYIPIRQIEISQIRIYLMDSKLKSLSLKGEPTSVTLNITAQ